MPITYGSVGDIIATVQVAAQLLKALSSSNGSAQDFQDLLMQLRTFHRCLDQLVSFWQTRKQCPELEILSDILLPVIRDSQGEISSFLDTIINKYAKSLSHNERLRRSYRNIGKMIQWHLFEADTIKRLKDKLSTSNTTIILIQMNVQGIAEERNKSIINEKLAELIELENTIEEKLDHRFDELMIKIDEHTTILNRISTDVGSVMSAVGPVANMSRDIGELVSKLDQHLVLNSISRNLDWIQQPVLFEDSIGRVFKIPLELINSWRALGTVLYDQFSGRQGQSLICQGRYVVQDAATGRDLSPRVPFNVAVRPGQTLHMAMLVHSPNQKEIVCPRCKWVVISSSEMDVVCSNPSCDMILRHITDVTDMVSEDRTMPTIGQSWNQDGDQTAAMHIQDDAFERLLEWRATEDTPEVFKRVRFWTQWYDTEDSRATSYDRLGQLKIWEVAGSALAHERCLTTMSVQSLNQNTTYQLYDMDAYIAVYLVFLGATRQHSVPVFILYSRSKRNRELALRAARELPWFRTSNIKLGACCTADVRDFIIRSTGFDPDKNR